MLNSRRKNLGAARRGMDVSQSVNAGSFVAKWHCKKCTYLNTAASKCCKMCLEPVKEPVKDDLHWNDLGSVIDETIAMSLREK
jgi:late competence protein required for DNA uptake (superfamily II DNA/RNA helicase)